MFDWDEIRYHVGNSLLAGLISFASAYLAAGEMNPTVLRISFWASALVALYKFKEYWDNKSDVLGKKRVKRHMFSFI